MFAITESWIHEHIYIYYHYYSKSQKMKRIKTVAKLIDTIRWARVFSLTILDHAKYYIVYVLVYNS